jgi:hypothetical protein
MPDAVMSTDLGPSAQGVPVTIDCYEDERIHQHILILTNKHL